PATFPTGSKDRRAEHAIRVACLWADLDVGEGKQYASKDDARDALRRFAVRPHIVLDTGHGILGVWLLEENEGRDLDRVMRLIRGLAQVLPADPAVALRSQVIRVPGTWNLDSKAKRKDGLDHEVRLIWQDPEPVRYTLDDFSEA